MATKIFVNLPVKNLKKSLDFFVQLGFKPDPRFTDDRGASLMLSEDNYLMLLTEDFFKSFTHTDIADPSKSNEVIIAFSAKSREEVDELADKAIKAGGREFRDPDDMDWMYSRNFQDLDGHRWEIAFMDLSQMPQSQ